MPTSTLGGHVNTIPEPAVGTRRRRGLHSDEFKASAVASCMQPGMSMAAVAMAHGINANLLRRWVHQAETHCSVDAACALPLPKPVVKAAAFIPLQCPRRAPHRTSASSCAAAPPPSP